jgi:tetratricopeptide (TPR) repeat protein
MERDGLVSPMDTTGNRNVLVSPLGVPISKPTSTPSPAPRPPPKPAPKPITKPPEKPESSKKELIIGFFALFVIAYLIFKALVWGYHFVKPYFASSPQTEQVVAASVISIDALPAEINKAILVGNLDDAKASLNLLFQNYATEQTKFPNLFDAVIKSSLHLGKAYADKEKLAEASATYKLAHDFFAQKNSALDASSKLLRVQVDANVAELALVAKNFQEAIEYGNSALAIKLFASDRDTTAAIKAAERAIIFAYFLDGRYEQAALAANKLDFNKLNKEETVQFQLIAILSKSLIGDLGSKNDYEKLISQYGQPQVDQSVEQIKLIAGESQTSELVAGEIIKLAAPRDPNSILDSNVSMQ